MRVRANAGMAGLVTVRQCVVAYWQSVGLADPKCSTSGQKGRQVRQ